MDESLANMIVAIDIDFNKPWEIFNQLESWLEFLVSFFSHFNKSSLNAHDRMKKLEFMIKKAKFHKEDE